MSAARLLVISPVRNEADHIEVTARALAGQTRRPDLWLAIDDGSTDGTGEILEALAESLPFLRPLATPTDRESTGQDRLAVALEAQAFNYALRTVDWRSFTHIAKLDGDIELPPDYFERLLDRFEANAELGIAGGVLVEHVSGRWRTMRVPDYHVRGAVKLYSRACFEDIGGIEERLGWDTIDETYARMQGFETHSFGDLVARHHRHWGTADGRLRGRARHGRTAYILRYGLPWVFMRSFKVATHPPYGLSGAAFLYGYLRAAVTSEPKVEDDAFRRFVRSELRGRMFRLGAHSG